MRQDPLNALDSTRLVLLQEPLDSLGDFPVAHAGLDGAEGDLACLVGRLEEVGARAGDGRRGADDEAAWRARASVGRSRDSRSRTAIGSEDRRSRPTLDARLAGNDGVAVNVRSDDNLDHIVLLERLSRALLV